MQDWVANLPKRRPHARRDEEERPPSEPPAGARRRHDGGGRSLRHRRRLGRRARRAHRGRLRRAGDDRGGISRRRHLRDPRLRAEEAAGLCLALCPRVRGRRGLWLDRARADVRLGDADRQQGQGDRAAGRPIRRTWTAPRSRSSRAAPCSRTRTRCGSRTGETRARQAHPDRDRGWPAGKASPAASTSSPRTRRFT